MGEVTRTILADGRILKTERVRKSSGNVIRVSVLTAVGRIVGVSEMQVPLMEGITLSQKVGTEEERDIEKALEAVAIRVADAVER
jgi:hypothetical protein